MLITHLLKAVFNIYNNTYVSINEYFIIFIHYMNNDDNFFI